MYFFRHRFDLAQSAAWNCHRIGLLVAMAIAAFAERLW